MEFALYKLSLSLSLKNDACAEHNFFAVCNLYVSQAPREVSNPHFGGLHLAAPQLGLGQPHYASAPNSPLLEGVSGRGPSIFTFPDMAPINVENYIPDSPISTLESPTNSCSSDAVCYSGPNTPTAHIKFLFD